MDKQQINPWTWQDALGFSQAWRISGASQILLFSGQAPISPEGQLVGEGDFDAQVDQVFRNLKEVLEAAGAGFDAIAKITVYLTDMTRLRDFGRIKAGYIAGPQPASTAVGVTALALLGMMVEVEAVALL